MSSSSATAREVALPVAVFDALRAEIEKDLGTYETVRALHQAGYHAGVVAARTLDREAGGSALELSGAGFWGHLSDYFSKRGWGSLSHEAVHPGVGVLSSSDWAESAVGGDDETACGISAGFLSGLLSQLTGRAVAVLVIRCRGRGDGGCDFAFGSEKAIHKLYGRMLDGAEFSHALQAL